MVTRPRRTRAEEAPLKTIGLIGGMSWASTLPCYRRLNELAHERLGGLHVRAAVDFALAEEPGR